MQVWYENSGKIQSKIGRPSNCKIETSSKINNGFVIYLKQKLLELIIDQERLLRKDQLNTEYFRIVKKIPFYFIENWSTKNLYKESDISKWIISFIQATSAYYFSQNNYSIDNWLERIVEFSVIFFPKVKWAKLISELMKIDDLDLKNHLKTQNKALKIRNGMSWTNIIKLVQLSPTMRSFFEISLQILQRIKNEIDDFKNIKIKHLNHDKINNDNKIKIEEWTKAIEMKNQAINNISSIESNQIKELFRKRLSMLIKKTEEIVFLKD